MMVSEWGEAGAKLYHKLRDGLESELAAHRETAGKTLSQRQELTVTIKHGGEEMDTYIVDKIEAHRGPQMVSEHRIDWKQLAMEAASPVRTRPPPSLLFIRGHAKFEGEKLAKIHSTKRKGIDPLHVQEKSVKLCKLSSNGRRVGVQASAKWCYCSIVVHGRQPTK